MQAAGSKGAKTAPAGAYLMVPGADARGLVAPMSVLPNLITSLPSHTCTQQTPSAVNASTGTLPSCWPAAGTYHSWPVLQGQCSSGGWRLQDQPRPVQQGGVRSEQLRSCDSARTAIHRCIRQESAVLGRHLLCPAQLRADSDVVQESR
jgi:hypothetical protein